MANQKKIWFITGISRGFGKAIAEEALSRGDVVIGTTRDGKSDIQTNKDRLHVLHLDVSVENDVKTILAKAHSIHDRLDVVVNNAGYGQMGAIEEVSSQEFHDQFNTNVFGAYYVMHAALPFLRKQKSGHIINISSIAGLTSRAGVGIYCASKYALEALSIALADEVKPLGIKVTIIEPGAFRTDFLADSSIRYAKNKIDAYSSTAGEILNYFKTMEGKQQGDPVLAAKAIVNVAYSDDPPLHLLLGPDALSRARDALKNLNAEFDKWEKISLSSDFAQVETK